MRSISISLEDNSDSWRAEQGSTLVEFALVLIVLLMLLFGIVDFGRALYTYHFVVNVAREGTRYAIVRGENCNPSLIGCRAEDSNPSTDPSSPIPKYVRTLGTGIGIDPSLISVTATWPGAPVNSTVDCSTPDRAGCLVQVQVTYPFRFIFPLMPNQTCTVGAGASQTTANICMTSTSQMVISQ